MFRKRIVVPLMNCGFVWRSFGYKFVTALVFDNYMYLRDVYPKNSIKIVSEMLWHYQWRWLFFALSCTF